MALILKKRRIVYLGIIIVCLLYLALSISGLFKFTTYAKREKNPQVKEIIDEDSKKRERLSHGTKEEDVSQEIYGLYLPNYDEGGKEVSVIRGAYTVFLNDRTYKITKPEIEFTNETDSDSKTLQSKVIVVTSDFGEMDKETNRGSLYGNVITRLGKDLEIHTEDFKYLPKDKTIYTDGPVTIQGQQMKITGDGMAIDMAETKAVIKNDPEMEIITNKDELFLFSDKGVVANRNITENIFIRASGELIFENKKKLATFHDNVRISRGKSTVFADKLIVPFDSNVEKIKTVTASGNVSASDGEKNAKGETLTWDSDNEVAILEDDPVAEFFDDKISITASKIVFSKAQGRMDIPVGGQLSATVNLNRNKNNENDTNKKTQLIFSSSSDKKASYESITINWKGKMFFEQDTNQAVFEDDVVVNKEGMKLYCGKLAIQFDDKRESLKEMEATKDIHMIEKRGDSIREASGDKLVWASTRSYIELHGNPLATVSDGEKIISAPKINFSESEKKVLAEGEGKLLARTRVKTDDKNSENLEINWNKKMVYNGLNQDAHFYEMIRVTKGKDKLNCDRLDVFFDDEDRINKATAFGNVYIASPDLENTEGLGTLLEWDLTKDLAVLTGNPLAELRRSGARTFSNKIFFDIKTKRVHWEGRPHWKIY